MKLTKYIPAIGAVIAALGFTACQDDFSDPAFEAPVAENQANMTILELKEMYWSDDDNYIDTVGYVYNEVNELGEVVKYPLNPDGTRKQLEDHIYIRGRVISNDSEGNIFKSLVIQDETAALAFSINQYDLYLQYRPGQEIIVDMTGMYLGKYNGYQQVGLPSWYEKGQVWNASFMPVEFFRMHAERNGFPEPAKIDTLEVFSFAEIPNTPEGLRKWQSQLVKFNNVFFKNADGKTPFSSYKSSGVDQPIVDTNGNTLNVRTSGYSTFWNNPMPVGNGDVVAIMSYYGSSGWQLLLNDLQGCMNFGNPTVAMGTEGNPYPVEDAIEFIVNHETKNAWVKGYIVGAVAPEVTEVKSNTDVEWTSEPVLANTLVIGATPDTKDINNALVISLPQGSDLRTYGNLVDHPENYKKEIAVKGSFDLYMGTYGVVDNRGTANEFKIEGVEINGGGSTDEGDGTDANPYSVAQVIAMNPTSTTEAVQTGVWVTGYIVGSIPTGGSSTVISGTVFGTENAAASNLVIAPSPTTTDYTQCVTVQLPSGSAVRSALNLKDNPGMLGVEVAVQGDIMKYCDGPGVKNTTDYKKLGDTPDNPGGDDPDTPGEGTGTETDPYSVASIIAMNPTSTTEAVATGVWVDGYIVGSIPTGGSSTVISGTEFGTDNAAASNLVLGPTADCKDYTQCIAVQLPSGSAVRSALNLKDNPGMLGAKVSIQGDVMKYCGAPGIKNTSNYKADGQTPDNPGTGTTGDPAGSGTQSDPYNVAKAKEVALAGGTTDDVYVTGTIASITEVSTSYGNATYAISDDGTTANAMTVFRGYYLNGEKFTSESQIKVGDKVLVLGKLTTYNSSPQVNTGSQIVSINGQTTGGDNPDPGTDPGTDPSDATSADFNTFNGGKPATSSYSTYTSTAGWVVTFAQIVAGGTDATNFISESTSFVCPLLDGTLERTGTLTSPALAGGLGTLTFKYGFPYNESKVQFTINIKQNGAVVATDTVLADPATKATAFNYSHAFNVSGDFVIEIINDCVTQTASGNKDRVAIWDMTWTH